LATEFAAAGVVKSANIITRGPRSLGYGFVEMETEEAAKAAVGLMNKKVIDGREINVEIAKLRDDSKAANKSTRPPPRRRGIGRRGGRRGGSVDGEDRGSPVPEGDTGAPRRRRFRGGFRGGRRGGTSPSKQQSPQRAPSQTVLFVANLPFTVDDPKLSEIFKGLKIKSAHVVRKKNGRSKGFGFVEFEDEADQQAALQAVDKKMVEERELIVKVALTENKNDSSDSHAELKEDVKAA